MTMSAHHPCRLLFFHLLCIALAWISTTDHHAHCQVGTFKLLLDNAGIASMHSAVTHYNTVILLDRTDIGPSQILLPNGTCRDDPNDITLTHDCTAHSVMFSPGPNTVRPLFVSTDTWCSSGQFLANGTMLQTGGDNDGLYKIRRLSPCPSDRTCNWVEDNTTTLVDGRWYATNQLLPDGRVIIVGGRSVFTYEFIPRAPSEGSHFLKLLNDTKDYENDNYYPYVHLLPNGNLYIFANRDSIQFDYLSNQVVVTYPTIPGNPRNYPSAGSSVLLPLNGRSHYSAAEVLVCGGAQLGAFDNPNRLQMPCSASCGRMVVTSATPVWAMETMPMPRCMGDMVLLPSRDVLIINGAQNGSQGLGFATNPAFNPILYRPGFAPSVRFLLQPAGTIPRMYHSTANLLPDGRVLLAGSNTHPFYTFTGDFPTELRVEAWSPPYMQSQYASKRPSIVAAPTVLRFGLVFNVTFTCPSSPKSVEMNLISAPFTTHSYAQGQRLLSMKVRSRIALGGTQYIVTVVAPPNGNITPPAYYMMFPVMSGIAGSAAWVEVIAS